MGTIKRGDQKTQEAWNVFLRNHKRPETGGADFIIQEDWRIVRKSRRWRQGK